MNNQMNNRLTVNDESVQRMIDNNSAMYYSNQMIITQNMIHRPMNTIKAYSAKQEEWKQTALGMHFADLFSLVLENQGISECIGTIPFGKTNQHSKIEYGSSVRHRDVEVCSVGALAMNLFSRFHFENEPFPDFTRCENWLAAALIKAKKEERWKDFNELEVLRQELKALRREEYTCRNSLKYTIRKQHSDDSVNLTTELKQTRFSGTDYGFKTMSVMVPISMKMFNTHLSLYNKFHPDNSLKARR
ncbi:hypothetical protein G6F70_006282 [Rhizopus microsporus]|nr:hypothetical protein G6F71_006157 [Rhizopus microsporus]KAG1197866.1 hypothetical protein G6F70_006282 [Rhizopus microsporus]KAG1209716.1 hypothetical protein G6F69_006105 [Rhizopus microsporus]KAG1231220.1 hypothetical protein G6F67_005908 [Rhizopus microsporus]KAG1263553.1 hypothetical protein G6F68_005060 [Rhizopus microsporus]